MISVKGFHFYIATVAFLILGHNIINIDFLNFVLKV